MPDVNIRRARPDDVEAAVPLIFSAGPEAFTELFSHGQVRAEAYLTRAFVKGVGLFGCDNHFVAEREDQVVGTISVYSGVEYNRLSQPVIRQIFTHYSFWYWPKVVSGLLNTKSWGPPPGRQTDYVANLGVSPEVRSQGIGAALLVYGLEYARKRGKKKYALDVAEINPRAQKLYERFGMQVVAERPSFAPGRVPNLRRMELALS